MIIINYYHCRVTVAILIALKCNLSKSLNRFFSLLFICSVASTCNQKNLHNNISYKKIYCSTKLSLRDDFFSRFAGHTFEENKKLYEEFEELNKHTKNFFSMHKISASNFFLVSLSPVSIHRCLLLASLLALALI